MLPRQSAPEYRVVITGSREFADRTVIRAVMRELTVQERLHGVRVTIVHGGARGADRMAGEEAEACGFAVEVHPANWAIHGKRAGILRNLEMLELGASQVFAFWDGQSKGTEHTIRAARERDMRVTVVRQGDAQEAFPV